METRFYQTQEITIPALAQALELEFQAQGYEAQLFGDVNQTTVQLKKESTLRAITRPCQCVRVRSVNRFDTPHSLPGI